MVLEIGISFGSPLTELIWQFTITVGSCKVKCLGIDRDTGLYLCTAFLRGINRLQSREQMSRHC
jgi:hypothetical protein